MSECNFNSSYVNFAQRPISEVDLVTKWLRFCKAAYIDDCDMAALQPPLSNLTFMYSEASSEDCLNTRELTAYCISLILSVLIIIANSVILSAFIYGRRWLLKSSNLPIISLAMSDLLTGITFLYSTTWNLIILDAGYEFDIQKTIYYTQKRANYFMCLTLDGPGLVFACMMSSVLTLGVIATDRYMAIFYSYHYQYWITTRRMEIAIVIIWVISVLVGILPLIGWNNWTGKCQLTEVMHYDYLVLWSSLCFISGLSLLFIYLRIFLIARKHSRQIEAQVTSTTSTSETFPSQKRISTESQQTKPCRQTAISVKSSKSTLDYTEDSGCHDDSCHDDIELSYLPIPEHPDQTVSNSGQCSGENLNEQKAPSTTQKTSCTQSETSLSNKLQKFKHNSEDSENIQEQIKENNTQNVSDRQEINRNQETATSRQSEGCNLPVRTSMEKKRFRKPTMKAIRTTAMILGAFYLSWTPLLIYLLLRSQNQYHNLIVYYLMVVSQLNSLFNPIMYGFRQSDIKNTLRKMKSCQRQ